MIPLSNNINELVDFHGWHDIPDEIVSREGYRIRTNDDAWNLPYTILRNSTINFGKISNPLVRWATKRFIQEKIQTKSVAYGYNLFSNLIYKCFRKSETIGDFSTLQGEDLKIYLIKLIEHILNESRKHHRLETMYVPITWYVWCTENYPELGFCTIYSQEIKAISIPGCTRGDAIRREDPKTGPLHRTLELPLLIRALKADQSKVFEHLQEKAALALSIALGRNPANLTYLKERDLENLTPNDESPIWVLKVPRIKKQYLNPRSDFIEEFLDTNFAKYLLELIEANKSIHTLIELNGKEIEIEKPLFIKINGNKVAELNDMVDSLFNMTSHDITKLLKSFVARHKIMSPITGKSLGISSRRLRYTLGSGLAAEGVSKTELARILDHTDTQHVHVYFELAGTIVEHLDKATAKEFSKILNLFKGRVIFDESEAINGERDDKHLIYVGENSPTNQVDIGICGKSKICHLDPPYSCYLCEKFQPYQNADHEHVLDSLLKSRVDRMKKYANTRLGIQLDDVILAVAQVVENCKGVK